MSYKLMSISLMAAIALSSANAADRSAMATSKLSAAEIVDKNVAVTGGLQAWHAVQTMVMKGKMEAGGNDRSTLPTTTRKGASMPSPRPKEQVQLPFVMELKRPRKMRVELQFNGQTAVQVFDGTNGWKLRPFLNRRQVEPYTNE